MPLTDPQIRPESWHSHIYFDAASLPRAEALVTKLQAAFPPEETPVTYGRWHQKPVGPHPDWSVQIAYPHDWFATMMTALSLHQDGLVIFTHPNTGESNAAQLRDHRDHAIWMAAVRPLKLDIFAGD